MSDDEDLREEVQRLREEVDALHRRLDALDGATEHEAPDADTTRPASGPRSDAATPPSGSANTVVDGPPDSTDESSTAGRGSASDAVTDAGRDWELAVGVRWLGVVGGLALVVGVVLFVRLAIEQGWLGPLGRIAAGTLGGLLLLGGGRYAATRASYVRWGRITAGAGLAIAYFSVYAAYGFESYREAIGTPLWVALAAMTLLVAATAAVSIRDRAPLVAGEAFAFGYVTATLSTEAATVVLTPAYALLLAAGLVAVVAIRPWSRLVVSSVPATYGVVGFWALAVSSSAWSVGVVAAAAFVVYLAGSYLLRRYDRVDDRLYRIQIAALTALNAMFASVLLEFSVRGTVADAPVEGLGPIAVALALAAFYAVTDGSGPLRRVVGDESRWPVDRLPRWPDAAAAATSVVLLAVGVGLATGTFATTVGALGVVCLGVGVARVADAPAFRAGAHLVAAGAVYKVFAVDAVDLPAFDSGAPVATLTGRPTAFGLAVVVCYGLAWLFSARASWLHERERSRRLSVGAPYATAATLLAVVGLWLELSGLGVTVAWVLFGVALLGVGFAADERGVRLLGVGVLGVATTKVFLFDTRGLDTVARTLSFLVLGAVLLAASYVYARSSREPDVGLRGD